ncbi:MAG TPA: hypothetical protein VI756_02285 [Blastocatellia bacterium]
MKEISVQELPRETAEWVRLAAQNEQIIITDNGQPISTLTAPEQPRVRKRLRNREEAIRSRPEIKIDSADYISEMRSKSLRESVH